MKRFLAALAVSLAMTPAAQAATLQLVDVPGAAVMMPTATATSGAVVQNITRDRPRYDNPWTRGRDYDPATADPNAYFSAIGAGGSATYSFDLSSAASFVWGSPDYHNKIEFLLGGVVVDSFKLAKGMDLSPAFKGGGAALAIFTDIMGGVFDSIRFSTPQYSFEIANLSATPAPAPVPLPAGAVLMISALGGLALGRRRKQRAA